MIAALSIDVGYYLGIDPYTDLKVGYDEILSKFGNGRSNYEYKISPFETCMLHKHDFNMVIMSPPPHTMEKYGYDEASQSGQSWDSYPDRTQWLINFMFASIYKIYQHMEDNGSFFLTIIDRLKGEDTLICTEAILMYASCIGMSFQHILYWEGGTQGMGSPFWIFKKTRSLDVNHYNNFKITYPDYYKKIRNQLNLRFGVALTTEIELTTEDYSLGVNNPNYKRSSTVTEIIRYNIIHTIFKLIHDAATRNGRSSVTLKKIQTVIGRWIMVQSINNLTNVDPLFPTNGKYNDQLNENIDTTHIINETYIISDILCNGLMGLFNTAITLTETITNRLGNLPCVVRKEVNKGTVRLYADTNLKTIEKESLGIGLEDISKICILDAKQYELLVSKCKCPPEEIDTRIYNCILRYASLGDKGHQFTREEARFLEYKNKYNVDFELFGAPFNVHASYHMSLFYDTDKYFGSYGSFFNATLRKGVYTVNPPNDVTFVRNVTSIILKMLETPNTQLTFLMGLVVWSDDDGEIKNHENQREWYANNGKNKNLVDLLKTKFVKDFILVDTTKYKALDPITGRTFVTGTEKIPILIIVTNV
jgi:hypothetical protein